LETLRTKIQRENATALAGRREISLGTIASYNPTNHTARVMLQPEGDLTGDLHVAIAWNGLHAPLQQGMSCVVAFDKGAPAVVVATWYDNNFLPPLAAFFFGDDVTITGDLTVGGGLYPTPLVALPTASAQWAGALVTLAATNTTDASLYYCQARHDGTYSWRAITLT